MRYKPSFLMLSVVFNILFFVGLLVMGIAWMLYADTLSDTNKLIKIKRQSAITIISVVEGELQGLRKQQVDNVMNNISKIRPAYRISTTEYCLFSSGIRSRCWGQAYSISPDETCFYYGGVDFLFKNDKFMYFDKHLKCSGFPTNGGFYNR